MRCLLGNLIPGDNIRVIFGRQATLILNAFRTDYAFTG